MGLRSAHRRALFIQAGGLCLPAIAAKQELSGVIWKEKGRAVAGAAQINAVRKNPTNRQAPEPGR
jgi:hypothetical protein